MPGAIAYAAVEAILLAGAVVIAPPDYAEKVTHFTWWGITSLLVFDLSIVVSPWWAAPYHGLYFVCAAVACTIALGVVAMSIMGCTLLSEAVVEMGAVGYIVGNTMIHYYPVARILAVAPPGVHGDRVPQALCAGSLLLTYLRVNPAAHVYGCRVPELAVAAVCLAGVLVAWVLEGALFKYYTGLAYTRKRA